MNLNQFEQNVINSFQVAKADITELYDNVKFILQQIEQLKLENEELREQLSKVKTIKVVKRASNKKVAKKVVKKKIVATRNSNKIHDVNCPFAQNIKPKNKITFTSKIKALDLGYKPCKCLN